MGKFCEIGTIQEEFYENIFDSFRIPLEFL